MSCDSNNCPVSFERSPDHNFCGTIDTGVEQNDEQPTTWLSKFNSNELETMRTIGSTADSIFELRDACDRSGGIDDGTNISEKTSADLNLDGSELKTTDSTVTSVAEMRGISELSGDEATEDEPKSEKPAVMDLNPNELETTDATADSIAEMKTTSDVDRDILCCHCSDAAKQFCSTCNKSYCKNCCKHYHNRLSRSTHTLISLELTTNLSSAAKNLKTDKVCGSKMTQYESALLNLRPSLTAEFIASDVDSELNLEGVLGSANKRMSKIEREERKGIVSSAQGQALADDMRSVEKKTKAFLCSYKSFVNFQPPELDMQAYARTRPQMLKVEDGKVCQSNTTKSPNFDVKLSISESESEFSEESGFSDKSLSGTRSKDNVCFNCADPSKKYCNQCEKQFCIYCCEELHKKLSMRKHTIVDFDVRTTLTPHASRKTAEMEDVVDTKNVVEKEPTQFEAALHGLCKTLSRDYAANPAQQKLKQNITKILNNTTRKKTTKVATQFQDVIKDLGSFFNSRPSACINSVAISRQKAENHFLEGSGGRRTQAKTKNWSFAALKRYSEKSRSVLNTAGVEASAVQKCLPRSLILTQSLAAEKGEKALLQKPLSSVETQETATKDLDISKTSSENPEVTISSPKEVLWAEKEAAAMQVSREEEDNFLLKCLCCFERLSNKEEPLPEQTLAQMCANLSSEAFEKNDFVNKVINDIQSRLRQDSSKVAELQGVDSYSDLEVYRALQQACGEEALAKVILQRHRFSVVSRLKDDIPDLDRKEANKKITMQEGNVVLGQHSVRHDQTQKFMDRIWEGDTLGNNNLCNVTQEQALRLLLGEGLVQNYQEALCCFTLIDELREAIEDENSAVSVELILEQTRNTDGYVDDARAFFVLCDVCLAMFTRNEIFDVDAFCPLKKKHIICLECFFIGLRAMMGWDVRRWGCLLCNEPFNDPSLLQQFGQHILLLLPQNDSNLKLMLSDKLNEHTVTTCHLFRWCAHCTSGNYWDTPGIKKMECRECKNFTCFDCKEKWQDQHEDLSCEEFKQWLKDNDSTAQQHSVQKHLAEHGIKCPQCQAKFELARGGCIHFVCSMCKFGFCGDCKQPYKTVPKRGLFCLHTRDCFEVIRDEDVTVKKLKKILSDKNVTFIENNEKGETKCVIVEQKEGDDEKFDEICGAEVIDGHGAMCVNHYKEYLIRTVQQNHIDPAPYYKRAKLLQLLRAHDVDFNPEETNADLLQIVQEKVPLKAED